MSLQICAPVSVIRNEKPNNSNNTCPYKTAKVRHLPQQIQSLSAQPPLPNVKHALATNRSGSTAGEPGRGVGCPQKISHGGAKTGSIEWHPSFEVHRCVRGGAGPHQN